MKNNKIEKPKNDVIYVRVSSKEQILGFSLDNQEKICREFSKRTGHEVLEIFREEGESAKTADRTQLQKLLRYCDTNRKKIGRVVVYKVDRFSRAVADYLALKAHLNRLGITLVSATESFENTPAGKLSETMLSAFAQFDNDVRSQRTAEGMKARALKGLWPGIAPWGYVNTKDAAGGKIIAPHPERAPVVKMLFEKYLTKKYTFKELANMANKAGQKSRHGLKMTKQLVAKIIRNPIYSGRVVIAKFEVNVEGSHQAIVSVEVFDEANSSKRGNAKRKMPRNRDSPDYPLRGIKCSGCGRNMSGGRTRSKTGKYHQYYSCPNGDCPKRRSIKKIDLEADFTNFLTELTPDNDHLDVLKEAIKLAHKQELHSVATSERKLTTKIAEVEDRKGKLLELRVVGNMPQKDFAQLNEKYDSQIAELKKERSCLSSPELEIDKVVNSGVEFLKHLPETWRGLDVKDLRVLRTLLFPENVSYYYPNIKTPEVACIYNLKPSFISDKTRQVTLQRIEL